MDIQDVEYKLKVLREKWIKTPEKRAIYELQARALKAAKDLYYREHPQEKLKTLDN